MQHTISKPALSGLNWPEIHSSTHQQAAAPAQHTAGTMLDGAVRYACPVNGSIVLVTDPATLAGLTSPLARMRCFGCGELHLLELGEAGSPTKLSKGPQTR
jgi:hypothetical protein